MVFYTALSTSYDEIIAVSQSDLDFICPSSAEGFSYAFRTALTLYRSLCKTPPSPASPEFFAQVCRMHTQLLRPLRLVLWTKTVKQQILYNPLLRRGIMRSGVQALHRIEATRQ